MTGVTRERVTLDVRVALSADAVIRTGIFVVVAGTLVCDVRAFHVPARVGRERRRSIQVTFAAHCVSDGTQRKTHQSHTDEPTTVVS